MALPVRSRTPTDRCQSRQLVEADDRPLEHTSQPTAELPQQQRELNIYHYFSHCVRKILHFPEEAMQTAAGLLVARVLFR